MADANQLCSTCLKGSQLQQDDEDWRRESFVFFIKKRIAIFAFGQLSFGKSMKSLTKHLTFNIKSRRGFVNITPDVRKLVDQSQVQEGLCLVNAMHITASVFINDNEDDYFMTMKNG